MSKFELYTFFIPLFLMSLSRTQAQYQKPFNEYDLAALASKGFIYAHHKSFNYLIKDYVGIFEVTVSKTTNGSKLWHHLYHIPKTGFAYSYTDFGNSNYLGHANTLYTFIAFRFIERRNFALSGKYSAGLAILSQNFDIQNNIYNIAIGSKLNAYLNLNLNFDFRLAPNLYLATGIGMSHFSNGGTQQPNKGINFFFLQSGIRYGIPLKTEIQIPDSIPVFIRKNEYSIIYSGGLKTLEPAGKKKYFVSAISINFERQFSHKSMAGIGIDLFKDNSRKEYLLEENIENPHGKDLFYAGGHISYDMVFGKTTFTFQMGVYFWNKAKYFQNTYNRFGLKYRFSNHLMGCLTLKTCWAAADFAEFGLGYRFVK